MAESDQPEPEQSEPKQKPQPDRITVVESVYHQRFTKQPTGVESRFSRNLDTREQPYTRQLTATKDWQPLDCGWLKSVGMLVISNDGSENDLLVGYGRGHDVNWIIPPGESMRGYPFDASSLRVCCQNVDDETATAEFTVHLFPS